MLCKEDRDEINGSSVYRDYIMEQTLDVVTYFYPDQLLTLTVDWPDIMAQTTTCFNQKILRDQFYG